MEIGIDIGVSVGVQSNRFTVEKHIDITEISDDWDDHAKESLFLLCDESSNVVVISQSEVENLLAYILKEGIKLKRGEQGTGSDQSSVEPAPSPQPKKGPWKVTTIRCPHCSHDQVFHHRTEKYTDEVVGGECPSCGKYFDFTDDTIVSVILREK